MAIKVIVNYPLPENQREYDRRAAAALSKILIDTLPPETIDKLIIRLKEEVKKEEQ